MKNRKYKIIAVANQKGGIGKTTVTINLASALSASGNRVLIIDMDPQGNAAAALGFHQYPYTVKDILVKIINKEEIQQEMGILFHEEGMGLLPADTELAMMDYQLFGCGEKGRLALKEYIDSIIDSYDYILIDCPPSLGMLSINALIAADAVMIPVLPEPLAIEGLQDLLKTILVTRQKGNPELHIGGILFINVDSRLLNARSIIEQIREAYQGKMNVFEAEIPKRVAVSEAQGQGKSIIAYERGNEAAEAFIKLSKEVVKLCE